MTHPTIDCDDDERRHVIRKKGYNGLDYLEVSDDQDELYLYFLGRAPAGMTADNVRIEGGAQITGIQVVDVDTTSGGEEDDDYVTVRVSRPGDISTYTLRLVNMPEAAKIDTRFDHLHFSFKIDCPSDLDCKAMPESAPAMYESPEIDYLAKDYASFRQLILDRLSLVMPDWRERHVPDIQIALVEVMAYVGDHLSYYQDAVATEAYIGTARQRISVRRHARLVDYLMHEGHNARAWVQIVLEGANEKEIDPATFYFMTAIANQPELNTTAGMTLAHKSLAGISHERYEVFEPVGKETITLYRSHNKINFYTWGDTHCCLPRGATRATLMDYPALPPPADPPPPSLPPGDTPAPNQPPADDPAAPQNAAARARSMALAVITPAPYAPLKLKVGDVLVFEEVIGPETANPADADMRKRHAVRLTYVGESTVDPLYNQPVVEIQWHHEDALPFELCLSATGPAPDCELLTNISIARGNIMLADHGRRIVDEDLGEVLLKSIESACEGDDCEGEAYPLDITRIPEKFRPRLKEAPLVFSQPSPVKVSAWATMQQDARAALPQIWLNSLPWNPGGRMLGESDDTPTLTSLARKIKDGTTYEGGYLRRLLSTATLAMLAAWNGTDDLPTVLRDALMKELMTEWAAQSDLLASTRTDAHFVAEIDNEGRAHLRFGNGDMGKMPDVGARFSATYRVGGGLDGNVGAGALAYLVWREGISVSGIELLPRNPLPAARALAAETMEEVKMIAPYAFASESQIQRAITEDDYARLVERDFATRVQRAAATFRWTGSWYEVLAVVDPVGGADADDSLLKEIEERLYRYRRIGHDLVVKRAEYVPLRVDLDICAMPGYARGDVKAALLRELGRGELPGGRRAFFHPDNLTFGGPIAMSRLVTAAHGVRGVESVTVRYFRRLENVPQPNIPDSGILRFSPLEIPRLDNDPAVPENGKLIIKMTGGR